MENESQLTALELQKKFNPDLEINYPILGIKPSVNNGCPIIEYKELPDSEIQYFCPTKFNVEDLPEAAQYLASRIWNGLPPEDFIPEPEPEPLTPQQKLEASGLTVEELKELLGL